MKRFHFCVLAAVFLVFAVSAAALAGNNDEEARRYLVRGIAAIEMSKNEKELAKAAVEFKKAIELAPNMADAWYNLGQVQVKIGQLKEAMESYRKYLALAPQAEDARRVKDEIIKLEYRLETMERSNATGKTMEIKNDGRFIAYDDDTVLDTKTNLMWASKDSGGMKSTSSRSARKYCENYRAGGYSDWRMPTLNELRSLSDRSKSRMSECTKDKYGPSVQIHVATELIDFSCFQIWASETGMISAYYFDFINVMPNWISEDYLSGGGGPGTRALPVRSAK